MIDFEGRLLFFAKIPPGKIRGNLMNDPSFLSPQTCHICDKELKPHPLYSESGAQYCPADGDFFIQRSTGQEPQLVFRPYDHAPPIPTIPAKTPLAVQESVVQPVTPTVHKPFAPRVEWELEPAEYLERLSIGVRKNKSVGRPGVIMLCNQTGAIFSSIREASAAMGIPTQSMHRHLRGQRKSVGGYTFTKLDDPYERRPPRKPPVFRKDKRAGERIRCDQTERIFPSIRFAAEMMKLPRKAITDQILRLRTDVYGYTFSRVKEN